MGKRVYRTRGVIRVGDRREWGSILSCAKEIGVNVKTLRKKIIYGECVKGREYRFLDELNPPSILAIPVGVHDEKPIKFDSMGACARWLGVDSVYCSIQRAHEIKSNCDGRSYFLIYEQDGEDCEKAS